MQGQPQSPELTGATVWTRSPPPLAGRGSWTGADTSQSTVGLAACRGLVLRGLWGRWPTAAERQSFLVLGMPSLAGTYSISRGQGFVQGEAQPTPLLPPLELEGKSSLSPSFYKDIEIPRCSESLHRAKTPTFQFIGSFIHSTNTDDVSTVSAAPCSLRRDTAASGRDITEPMESTS